MTNTNAITGNVSDSALSDASAIIFAPATAPGRAGVAVYRISGQNLNLVMQALSLPHPLKPRYATLCELKDTKSGETIDQALALYFPAPHSFTGEEVLELHCHGGLAIRTKLMACLSALPHCRLAEPGEFSKRAFLNNKMDLVEAEGLADLIEAETETQRSQALAQLGGATSKQYESIRETIIRALALLEAYIDFPDEEIPEQVLNDVNGLIASLKSDMDAMLSDDHAGELIRDGIRIAIIGPPNAGKSSLLNALAKKDVAIVSDIPGTTRDRIEVHLDINGYFVRTTDTAGLRDSDDQIESEGVRRAIMTAEEADITFLVLDIVTAAEQLDEFTSFEGENTLLVLNKSDLFNGELPAGLKDKKPIILSALQSSGLDELFERLGHMIEQKIGQSPSFTITRQRHRNALNVSRETLNRFDLNQPLELTTEELRHAAFAIGKITGKIDVDALLDVIFREFCIGK